jgi:hypothetical protein
MPLFEQLTSFITRIRELGEYTQISKFVEQELLMINFLLIAIGFIVLLIEIRLPLRHYWDLPKYSVKRFLQNFHILPADPVWGTVKDDETNQRIPLTVVELVDRKSLRVVASTFTNRLGEFGFKVKPGSYFVRAVKNYYQMPSFIDPENIELIATDESFAMPVEVGETPPTVQMRLLRLRTEDTNSGLYKISHYSRTFVIAISNGSLLLSILISYFAWVMGMSPTYGILIVVGILMLFVKIYILETVGSVSQNDRR